MRIIMLLIVALAVAFLVAPKPMSATATSAVSGACKCNGPTWPKCPGTLGDTCSGNYANCPEDKNGANNCQAPQTACKEKLGPGGDVICSKQDSVSCL